MDDTPVPALLARVEDRLPLIRRPQLRRVVHHFRVAALRALLVYLGASDSARHRILGLGERLLRGDYGRRSVDGRPAAPADDALGREPGVVYEGTALAEHGEFLRGSLVASVSPLNSSPP